MRKKTPTDEPSDDDATGTPARILIVEDENITAKHLKTRLEKLGYLVTGTVSSGDAAIKETEANRPDIILMDITLTGQMDGIEAAEKIQGHFDIPVIYITAYESKEIIQRAKITGPYGYLLKPLNERELHIIIEITLYRKETEKKLGEYNLYLERLVDERTAELSQTIEKLNNEIRMRKMLDEELRMSEEVLRQRNIVMERDLKNAQAIHKALLPTGIPVISDMDIQYRYLPMDAVGGDYFSFTPLSEGGIGIFIGDVESHGVTAALFTSLVKFATNRACRQFGQQPSQYLLQLNRDLTGHMASSYITAIYAFCQFIEEGDILEAILSVGGHPYPLLQKGDTGKVSQVEHTGPLVGYFPDASYSDITINLEPGDRLYLYTDGITETMNHEDMLLGYDGFTAIVEKSQKENLSKTLEEILRRVKKYNHGRPFNDDVVLLGIENRKQ